MIRAGRHGPVALLTIDRPERRNAVNAEMCEQLLDGLQEGLAAGARAVVLTGAGGNFCAGADLGGVEDDHFRSALRSLLLALSEAPVATIAAVEGFALGAGTQLAVACDLRVVAPDARFGVPAAKLGLMVDHWTVRRVAAMVPQGTARAMLLACEEVDADTAMRVGFAQRRGGLDDAIAWAEDIARLAPLTIAGQKLALNRVAAELPPDPEVDAAITRAWTSDDLREGMAAFRERRPPEFTGR